ncbi:hypothetical protein [Paraburkholderia fungorum]|uniref:hypothetical protein n=1 Tax=Paraburkholderia fungorum TaxID=134537 RepID=UPI000941E398|nr:hypothetical protein [Paraburkholderia fungorum]
MEPTGAAPLKPEKSTNFDLGLALNPLPKLTLMLAVRANNLFNVYPKTLPADNRLPGIQYETASSQTGVNGESYYH